jgi:hypothetical protein
MYCVHNGMAVYTQTNIDLSTVLTSKHMTLACTCPGLQGHARYVVVIVPGLKHHRPGARRSDSGI